MKMGMPKKVTQLCLSSTPEQEVLKKRSNLGPLPELSEDAELRRYMARMSGKKPKALARKNKSTIQIGD
jgi:hypothetical protein